MPDIVMACNIDAAASTVFGAISTSDGVSGLVHRRGQRSYR